MPTWIVSSATSSVCADGAEWLDALASALPHFDFTPGTLGALSYATLPDGTIDVYRPRATLWLRVAPFPNASTMFSRCEKISAAGDLVSATQIALDLVRESVPAESGAVLLTTPTASRLEFMSAFGPKAERVIGTCIPADAGIAGFVSNFPTPTIVHRVQRDCRFYSAVDRTSKYHTESMLAVPITTRDSPCFGCLQLLNAPDHFHSRDIPMAATIASALAAWLLAAEL